MQTGDKHAISDGLGINVRKLPGLNFINQDAFESLYLLSKGTVRLALFITGQRFFDDGG
ncbi:MAG: hypothetical protein WCH01_06920 [Methylococcaceae bacterium]